MAEGTKVIVGLHGFSAADVARQNGFVGDDAAWVASLQQGAADQASNAGASAAAAGVSAAAASVSAGAADAARTAAAESAASAASEVQIAVEDQTVRAENAVSAAQSAATDAAAAAGLVGAPAGDAVLAAISEGGAARSELSASIFASDPYSRPWAMAGVGGQSNAGKTDYPTFALRFPMDYRLCRWDSATSLAVVESQTNDEIGFSAARAYVANVLDKEQKVVTVYGGRGETGFSSTSISPAPAGYSTVPNGTWERTLTADPKNLALQFVANLKAMAAAAPAGSRWAYLIWSQGEQDRTKILTEGLAWYQAKLDDLFAWIRSELGEPGLPIIVMSQTPETIKGSVGGGLINRAHEGTPSRVQRTAYVHGPEGYTKAAEDIHFTTPGHSIRGRLAIEALPKAEMNAPIVRPGQPLNVRCRVLGTEATARWESPVQRATGYSAEMSTDYGATWQPVPLVHAMALSATFTVTAGAPAWVRVRSTNEYASPSLWSEIAIGGGSTSTPTPPPSPTTPINDYTAESLTLGAITSWADSKGGDSLVGTSTVNTADGHKYVSLNGTSDFMRDTAISGIKTVAIVAKGAAGVDAGAFNLGAAYAHGIAAGHFKVVGGTTNYPTFTRTQDQWNVQWLILDGTNRTFTINSEDGVAGTVSAITNLPTYLSLGIQGTTYGKLDVARVLTFGAALNATQRAEVAASLTPQYTPWLP